MALTDQEVRDAITAERTLHQQLMAGQWASPAVYIRMPLYICLEDAVRRQSAALGITQWNNPMRKGRQSFVQAALRLAIVATANPTAEDLLHLQQAGLA